MMDSPKPDEPSIDGEGVFDIFYWTGFGFLAAFLGLGVCAASITLPYYTLGKDFFNTCDAELALTGGLFAGGAVYFLGAFLNKDEAEYKNWHQVRYYMYGREFRIWQCARHTLYGLPMQYWGIGWVLVGIGLYFLGLIHRHDLRLI